MRSGETALCSLPARQCAWQACVLVMFVVLCVTFPARAEMSEAARRETLDKALVAFDRATELTQQRPREAADAYRQAVQGFESLVADGVHNGKLYYNLGNAYLQTGDLGRAIVNYRRAEELIGHDAPLQANLRLARSMCRNQIRADGGQAALRTALFWHYDTSTTARFWTALAAYVVFWGAMIARSLTRSPAWGYAAVALLVVWLAAGTSTSVDWWHDAHTRAGVTVADEVLLRKGNGEGYEPQFTEPLHQGVEFTVVDERPGWYKVELADGSTGWLKRGQAELI